jgi:hypothetical protein
MRLRDVRAITFCVVSTAAVAAVGFWLLPNWVMAVFLALAYGIFVGTRPRMLRTYRRLRGETVEMSSYHWD